VLTLLLHAYVTVSGVPQIKYSSLFGVIAGRLIGRKNMPGFTWKKGELPEQVRWRVRCAQHAAKYNRWHCRCVAWWWLSTKPSTE
jgi:hypothetical protein